MSYVVQSVVMVAMIDNWSRNSSSRYVAKLLCKSHVGGIIRWHCQSVAVFTAGEEIMPAALAMDKVLGTNSHHTALHTVLSANVLSLLMEVKTIHVRSLSE